MDIRRFGTQYRSRRYALARSVEIYATYYDIHYPNEERSAGRPLKTAPTYERLRQLGPSSARRPGGSARTGFGPTRTIAWSTCGREAGRVSTGRRRSSPNTRQRANTPACSTSPRSRRSRSRATKRARSFRGYARTHRSADRTDRLHADAEPPRRDRVRPDRHAARGRPFPARHRNGVRRPTTSRGSASSWANTSTSGSATSPARSAASACGVPARGTSWSRSRRPICRTKPSHT